MKSAWIAAFALPLFVLPLSHPQQASSEAVPASQPTHQAKAVTTPAAEDLFTSPVTTEEHLRQALVGKQIYLRGLWLDDELHFDPQGQLTSQSPLGSFTLCAIEIEHVSLDKKHVELEGVRYGIHFADEADWAQQSTSFDRIRVTPKKKRLVISIARLQVLETRKKSDQKAAAKSASAQSGKTAQSPGTAAAASPAPDAQTPSPSSNSTYAVSENGKWLEATSDPAKAAEQLEHALNRVFSPSLDSAMISKMPDYWQYFYQAQLDHKSIEPTDPNIVRPGPGINGPKLIRNLVAGSNDYAQRCQVAGVATFKVILGPDGKPLAVAVYRPIGFGLDENGAEAIKKSTFAPAYKEGKAVSSVINMDVNFRIYSGRTAPTAAGATQEPVDAADNVSPVTGKPSLPGLFTVKSAPSQAQPAPQQNQ
jgi:hypothetical protein